MACPYFDPREAMDPGEWIHAPRLPLIEAWRGVCRAGDPFEPEESVQREVCNCGYARGRCAHFREDGADAVRFSMEDGETPRVIYIFEKNGAPVTHGTLAGAGLDGSEILHRQARAFAESWRRRMDHFQSSRGGEKVSTATESSSTSME